LQGVAVAEAAIFPDSIAGRQGNPLAGFFWVVSVDRKAREMPDFGVAGDFLSE